MGPPGELGLAELPGDTEGEPVPVPVAVASVWRQRHAEPLLQFDSCRKGEGEGEGEGEGHGDCDGDGEGNGDGRNNSP